MMNQRHFFAGLGTADPLARFLAAYLVDAATDSGARLLDRSGHGRDATQPTPALRLGPGQLNGRDAVRGTSATSDKLLRVASPGVDLVGEWTVYAVLELEENTPCFFLGVPGDDLVLMLNAPGNGVFYQNANGVNGADLNLPLSTPLLARWTLKAGAASLHVNSTLVAGGLNYVPVALQGITGDFTICGGQGAPRQLNGLLGAFLLAAGADTPAQAAATEQLLATRYGLSL